MCARAADAWRAGDALVTPAMVGVGVAEGGGGPAGGEPFYGEYLPYPPEFYVPPEMCANPQQHPPHAHMCTVHTEYGKLNTTLFTYNSG